MITQNIQTLKKLRAELAQQVAALDFALSTLERIGGGDDFEPVEVPETTTVKGKARNTPFESSIDLTKLRTQPEGPWTCPKCGTLNPVGARVCMECKKKKPEGIRND